MEKFDIKKIGIVLAIIAVVVLAIFLISKAFTGNVDKESLEKYEKTTIDYYLGLTAGLNTPFDGYKAKGVVVRTMVAGKTVYALN